MIKIFSAKNQYRDEVVKLWQASFGDSEEYINFFLDNCPSYDTVGYFIDDKPISLFFMLEGQVSEYGCKYLYAACTASEHRRQGIMEKLIKFAQEHYKNLGYDGIFLVPASEKLYSYYGKFGFISSFAKSAVNVNCCFTNYCETKQNIDIKEITNAKLRILNSIDSFIFDKATVEYTIKEHLFNGGSFFYSRNKTAETLFFYYTSDNGIIIKEYLNSENELDLNYCKQILNNNAQNVYILYPLVYNKKDIVEEYTKCGMCLPLNSVFEAYLKNNNNLYAGMYLD